MSTKMNNSSMKDVIAGKVENYLIVHVGELTSAGAPMLDETTRLWHVPVHCWTPDGTFVVGEFLLDESGEFIEVPDKEQMVRNLKSQLKVKALAKRRKG